MKESRPYAFSKIYEGKDIRVFYFGMENERILMTFTQWANKPPRKPFYPTVAHVAGMGFIGFVSLRNHRWQTPELPEAFDAIKKILRSNHSITTFGVSMGGTGAIFASQFIDVKRVIAVAPRPTSAPSSNLELGDEESASFASEVASPFEAQERMIIKLSQNISDRTEINILYDPFYKVDTPFVEIIEAARGKVKRWPLPFANHTPLLELKQSGLLREFTQKAIVDNDINGAHALYRRARYENGLFSYNASLRRNCLQLRKNRPQHFDVLNNHISSYGPNYTWLEARAAFLAFEKKYLLAARDYEHCETLTGRKKFAKLAEKMRAAHTRLGL
ncbi:MAG: hypothetical protein ACK46Q_08515 [Hyphomonas sp.]